MEKITKKQISSRIGLVRTIAAVLDDKQASDIRVLLVEKKTSLTNYFVICEGRSSTHVRSLADELEAKLHELDCAPIGQDASADGSWIVLDYASVIVHIFDNRTRNYYNLEKLWADGKEISLNELIPESGDEK